ncbi:MAG: hypothetical protein ACJA08_000464 [Cyclobacteriaceae bacterium]|jgi:hypothetical protein
MVLGQVPGATNVAGVYQGRPIFIQNTFDPEEKDFCIKEIRVNERTIEFNMKMSAIKLDFKGLDLYAPVTIHIVHKESCRPIVINPDAIFYHSIFSFSEINMSDSTLIWKTLGEKEHGQFLIEKIDMGIWQEEAVIEASGHFESASYKHYPKIEEGSNKFRIKYLLPDGKYLYSREIDFHFYPDPVTFRPQKTDKMIFFSRTASYKVYDGGNSIVMEGIGKDVDISKLPSGSYVIYFNEDDPGLFIRE